VVNSLECKFVNHGCFIPQDELNPPNESCQVILSDSTPRNKIQLNRDFELGMRCAPTIEKKSGNP
jgi:hypothetical protein